MIASGGAGASGPRNASAYACMVVPMSPRLTSRMVSVPDPRRSASTRSSTATPAAPNTSKNADCGFTAATWPANASAQVRAKRSTPATS